MIKIVCKRQDMIRDLVVSGALGIQLLLPTVPLLCCLYVHCGVM